MGLSLKGIAYENGKILFTFIRERDEGEVYFNQNIPRGSSARYVRLKLYETIAEIMNKEDK